MMQKNELITKLEKKMLRICNQFYQILNAKSKFLLPVFFVFCSVFITCEAFAESEDDIYAQQIKCNSLKTLIAKMDVNRVNRISVTRNQITEVIGDTGEFSYEIDGKGNVFVSPSVVAGESFEVTINLDNGKTQSLRFNVGDIGYGQTIILNDEELNFAITSTQGRIIEIIKSIKAGELDLVDKSRLKTQFTFSANSGDKRELDIAKIKEVKVLGDIKSFILEIAGPAESFSDFKERDLFWSKGKILAVALEDRSFDSNVLKAIVFVSEDKK